MTNFFRMTSLAATVAALALTATPAMAVTGPTIVQPDSQAKATARIVKPLTLTWVRDLDLGTIVLSGANSWSGAVVGIDKAGVFSCTDSNVTCSGTTKNAEYNITGTNNQVVTVTAPNVTLTDQNDTTKTLTLAVDAPKTVTLANSGTNPTPLDIGGSVTVASNTPDGTYTGTFAVTVNY
ncbi:DUF4402 domain-containing protein [Sphingomonas sp.]|uniref:DUF4402 domain-containing protein n=1 Tax=Sphingomonas sp. TaxID=28214 RepID=UPI0025F4689E|nr:DUF4402 domain-containing protein [Sphingomonas sp.]MBV9527534.1 DUF4402 domain-containing protein [Sphingomonas sp.]